MGGSLFFSLAFVLAFSGIFGFFIFQNLQLREKRAELRHQLETLQTQVQEISQKKSELEAGIAERQTEYYQEKALREQGLYKKPGEEVVTVLPLEEQAKQEEPKKEKKKVWWNPFTWVGDN